MLVSDFTYDLPEDRIAKFPPKVRGTTRLLVLDKKTGEVKDSYYKDLVDFLNPGDLLILNDTRVMQSRLFCQLPDGRKRELVVLEKHGDEPQHVMYRGKLHDGDMLEVFDDNVSETVLRRREQEERSLARNDGPRRACRGNIVIKHVLGNGIAEVESETPLADLAEKYGTVPLPPYLHRDATVDDKKRYQTVWARNMGSAAAPTASLNMTEELLEKLKQKGVVVKYLTLHVGLGTFLPIRTDNIEDHKMHSEWYSIPEDTLREIQHRRVTAMRPEEEMREHPRVIALGTTVARTLEYYAKTGQTEGEDDIFIYPGFEFQLVDALITNFHAPKTTVLMLASAFAGWGHLKNAYDHAIEEKYNF
ncbi:tRNA preQ1(34) S-adenosylmethionine ribosyltransferase-isomerase QueA, partial [Candidatus Saccharibacteria bacterium]|nr:tRNA preQ1(34) S-adenosylmethionine ribosyltransferase-isomerase QueA [Candidatus Saccharibacteria bacterium]